jgi:cytochrome c peroxidase
MKSRLRILAVSLVPTTLVTIVLAQTTPNTPIQRVPNPPLTSDLVNLPGDLRAVSVPKPSNLDDFIKDYAMARALGKALFWDMQVGSDNVQACATCHFRAGADPRSKNQVSPGLKQFPKADITYSPGLGPNHQLEPRDFPLTQLAVTGTRGALGATDTNDVVSSQGIHHPGDSVDTDSFAIGTVNTRRVEPRNTPTVINAVFNHRQFWDGRAENVFNGVNHLGQRDPDAKLFRADDFKIPVEVRVELVNASLASQAVAPILSDLEMAAPGRTRFDVSTALARGQHERARKLTNLRPLAKQLVSPTDSVLGAFSRSPNKGLSFSRYDLMIQEAFHEKWWKSLAIIRVNADGSKTVVPRTDSRCDRGCSDNEFSLLQYNFSLFFGIAVQLYEATLVSDDTPWDRFRREHPNSNDPALNPWTNLSPTHISRLALFGAHLFNDRTKGPTNVRCSNCHEQNELTDASVRRIAAATANGPVRNRDGNIIDKGFNNIGIRPTNNDLGVGAEDAFGPISFTRRRFPTLLPASPFDGAEVTGFGVDGAFKVPSLRNVALTAPYFHNGDVRTLREVVELYSRGGNVAPILGRDGATIVPLGLPSLAPAEIDAIIAFMEALTDERVVFQRAPFDHPQIFVPNGHPGDHTATIDANQDHLADDIMVEIPAVGAAGGNPIPGFLEGVFGPTP